VFLCKFFLFSKSLFVYYLGSVCCYLIICLLNYHVILDFLSLSVFAFPLAVIKPLIKNLPNLPFMSKILEKVVSVQLCSLLQHNDIYEKVQSGFRNGASSNYK